MISIRDILHAARVAPALLFLAACSHGGGNGSVGGGGTVPPPPPTFGLEDLEGDWVGQLLPDNPARASANVYLRFLGGELTEAAESAGSEWREGNSERAFEFSAAGVLEANLGLLAGVAGLEIQAEMDEARAVLSGTYTQVGPDLFPVTGSIELVRSSGPDMFGPELLEGFWTGTAHNSALRTQGIELTFDFTGAVTDGKMIRSGKKTVRRTYSPGAGTFAFSDPAIGRMDGVTLTSDNGVVTEFHFLLLDRDGTLLGGPGTDPKLGAGILRIVK